MSDHIRRKGDPPICVGGLGCSQDVFTPSTTAATGVVSPMFGISTAAGPLLTDVPANVPQLSTNIVPASSPASFASIGPPPNQPDLPGVSSTQGSSLASPTVAANSPISNSAASANSKSGSSLSNGAIAGVAIAA